MAARNKFHQNIELDAQMVYAFKKGDNYELMNFEFKNRKVFPNSEAMVSRYEWFNKQDKEYKALVNKVVLQLENTKK